MKKKYEYQIFILDHLVKEKRGDDNQTSDFVLRSEVLKEIGWDGWELFMINNDVVGKREIET